MNNLIKLINNYNQNKDVYNEKYLSEKKYEIEKLHVELTKHIRSFFNIKNFLKLYYIDKFNYKHKISYTNRFCMDFDVFNKFYKIYKTYNNLSVNEYIKLHADIFLSKHTIRQLKYSMKNNIKNKEIIFENIFKEYLIKHLLIDKEDVEILCNRKRGRKHSLLFKSKMHLLNKKNFSNDEKISLFNKYINNDVIIHICYKKNYFLKKIIDLMLLENSYN